MLVYSPITPFTTLGCTEGIIDRILQFEDIVTPSGLQYVKIKKERILGGAIRDDKKLQQDMVQMAVDMLGSDVWLYGDKKGNKCRRLMSVFKLIQRTDSYSDVPYITFYGWFDHYLKFGETKAERRHRNRKPSRRKGAKPFCGGITFSLEDKRVLAEIIQDKPWLYLDEIRVFLRRRVGKTWHYTTIWREMHRLGYTLQAAVYKAKQRNEAERDLYRERLSLYLTDARQALFIDETHKSSNASRRRRMWSKKGVSPSVDAFFEEDFRRRYTLIGACDINGFVNEACQIVERERDKNDRDPERGTVDSDRFEDYILTHVVPVLGNWYRAEPRSVVIMDNASIHGSDRVRDLIEGAGAKLIYTAPYSPDLNPIEFMFSVYKAALQRFTHGGYDWQIANELALEEMTPTKAHNFFRKAEVPCCHKLQESQGVDIYLLAAAHAASATAVVSAVTAAAVAKSRT
jgi:transposase